MFMFHFFLVYEEYIQGQMERQGVGGGGCWEVMVVCRILIVGRSVLTSIQTLTLVKTIIIHFTTCLTTTDLILGTPIHLFYTELSIIILN